MKHPGYLGIGSVEGPATKTFSDALAKAAGNDASVFRLARAGRPDFNERPEQWPAAPDFSV